MEIIGKFTKWLLDNSKDININIIAGLVASFIVLVFQTFVRSISLIIASFFTLRYQLKILWQFRKPERIFVVSGSIETPLDIKTAILAGPDADAANTLIATLGLIYPDADIHHVYSSAFPKELYKENLVVVGGPINNSCSRDVLDQLKKEAYFDEFALVIGKDKFEAVYDAKDEPLSDFGLIIRTVNPFDCTKDLILVAGCDTHGVLGAATSISLKSDAISTRKQLKSLLGIRYYLLKTNYIVVTKCNVLGNDISGLDVIKFKII